MPPFADADTLAFNESCGSLTGVDSKPLTEQQQQQQPKAESRRRGRTATASKSVRFCDYDDVVEIKHIVDFSKRDVAATWWSNEDRAKFRQAALHAIHRMENDDGNASVSSSADMSDFRGLDQHTQEYSEKSRANVDRLYDIVYEVQSFEDTEGVLVPEQVLAGYMNQVSHQTALEARARAVQDELAAFRVL